MWPFQLKKNNNNKKLWYSKSILLSNLSQILPARKSPQTQWGLNCRCLLSFLSLFYCSGFTEASPLQIHCLDARWLKYATQCFRTHSPATWFDTPVHQLLLKQISKSDNHTGATQCIQVDMVEGTWCSNRASEWEKDIISTLNTPGSTWLLVQTFNKLLNYQDFITQPLLGLTENDLKTRKYPVSSVSLREVWE